MVILFAKGRVAATYRGTAKEAIPMSGDSDLIKLY
jgi:hypothetical protein